MKPTTTTTATPIHRRCRRTAPKRILTRKPVKDEDAARLILEALEELGSMVKGKEKDEVLRLLRRVLHSGICAVRQAESTVSFARAAAESLGARSNRRPLTRRDLRYFTGKILRNSGLSETPMRSISANDCRRVLQENFSNSIHSYRKARAILHSIFAYALRREWVDKNPVDSIETPQVVEHPITPLPVSDIARLEAAARAPLHRTMQLSLHLMLYCGVRPNEVQRLNPSSDIDWTRRLVLIRPQTSKTGGGRIIPLRKASRIRRDCRTTIPRNWKNKWRALRRSAGFAHWQADICRHTFASYHAQHFRDLPKLQLEMGHRSTDLLRTRYIMATLGKDAQQFWK